MLYLAAECISALPCLAHLSHPAIAALCPTLCTMLYNSPTPAPNPTNQPLPSTARHLPQVQPHSVNNTHPLCPQARARARRRCRLCHLSPSVHTHSPEDMTALTSHKKGHRWTRCRLLVAGWDGTSADTVGESRAVCACSGRERERQRGREAQWVRGAHARFHLGASEDRGRLSRRVLAVQIMARSAALLAKHSQSTGR